MADMSPTTVNEPTKPVTGKRIAWAFIDAVIAVLLAIIIVHEGQNSTASIIIGAVLATIGVNFLFNGFGLIKARKNG